MVKYHAMTRKDCQSYVRYIWEVFGPRSNRTMTMEPAEPIALLIVLEQQKNLIRNQGPMQATLLDQDIYVFGV